MCQLLLYLILFYYSPLEACLFFNERQKWIWMGGRWGRIRSRGKEAILEIHYVRGKTLFSVKGGPVCLARVLCGETQKSPVCHAGAWVWGETREP